MIMLNCFVFLLFLSSGCCGLERKNDVSGIFLRHYIISLENYAEYNLTNPVDLIKSPSFNLEKMTVIYIIGYKEYLDADNTKTVMSAYLQRGDHNPIVLDWTNLNRGNYVFEAVPITKVVAQELSKAINTLVNLGLNPDLIHLVGHSMGGQIAGFAGRNLPFKLHRITLLDAAYPGFHYDHAKSTDAKFVDAIHTDSNIYGHPLSIGHVDFWPNGGKRHQPGCPLTFLPFHPEMLSDDDLCSHWRSWRFWAESLLNEKAFPAMKCLKNIKNYIELIQNDNGITAYMGIAIDRQSKGNFCLVTNKESPFGCGQLRMITNN